MQEENIIIVEQKLPIKIHIDEIQDLDQVLVLKKKSSLFAQVCKSLFGKIKNFKLDILILWLIICLGISFFARMQFLDYPSPDYKAFLVHWHDFFVKNGAFEGLKNHPADYNVPYLYLLSLSTLIEGEKVVVVKFISIIFDYILAAGAFFATWQLHKDLDFKTKKFRSILAVVLVLFSPVVYFNSAIWSQADMIFTAFCLFGLGFLFQNKGLKSDFWSILFFAVAFAFKLQTIFLVGLFGLMILAKPIRWLLFPSIFAGVWAIFGIPYILAGNTVLDYVHIYTDQSASYSDRLNLNIPNFFSFFPEDNIQKIDRPQFKNWGITVAIGSFFTLVATAKEFGGKITSEIYLQTALLSSLVIPYFLPKMHERYYYLAEVLSILLAIRYPKLFWIPIVLTSSALFTYNNFVFGIPMPLSYSVLSLAIAGIIGYLCYFLHQSK